MSGVAGKSGRPRGRMTLQDEALKLDVVNRCWQTLHDMMISKKVTFEAKCHVALEICKRNVPQQIKIEGDYKIYLTDRIQKSRAVITNRIEPIDIPHTIQSN